VTSVALVHDYLTQRGGAERVVLHMAEAFPEAPLHTSLFDPSTVFDDYADIMVRPMAINDMALLRRHHRLAFPVLAWAFCCITIDADVTLISSSGWAHGVRTTGRKIVYCHAPARWLYQTDRYLASRGPLARAALSALKSPLRSWDQAAARSADQYLVNSTFTRDQVRSAYGIDATVVHPPHHMDADAPRAAVPGIADEYVLCVARLQGYKNVDAVVRAMELLPDLRLVVVGDGPQRGRLQRIAGGNVTFLRDVDDAALRWLYANAAALVGASYEDFGLTPVEAAAFGVPTVALRFGGYLDTVVDGRTGLHFDGLAPGTVAAAVRDAVGFDWDRDVIRAHARQFDAPTFRQRLRAIVDPAAASLAEGAPLEPTAAS
jgi:glycosyltransferase involved in cell wall biosynthesis